jgi:hypothetical protein
MEEAVIGQIRAYQLGLGFVALVEACKLLNQAANVEVVFALIVVAFCVVSITRLQMIVSPRHKTTWQSPEGGIE